MKKTIRTVLCFVLITLLGVTVIGCKKSSPALTVQEVTVTPTTASLRVGESIDLAAEVTMSDGTVNSDVTFTSSDVSVVSLNGGKATALKIGSATVTATSTKDSSKKADCNVTVTATPAVTISQTTLTMLVGETHTLTASVTLADGSTNSVVSWESSNTTVATVSDSGVVSAVKNGSVTVTATSASDSTLKATCAVTVNCEAKIEMNKPTATLTVGGAPLMLTATVRLANGSVNTRVSWESSNTAVATVSDGGVVSAVKAGNATITATSKDIPTLKATCAVTVLVESGISLSKTSALIGIGNTATITATVTLANGTTNGNVTWTTSNPDVATVDGGVITGIAFGNATITATSKDIPTLKATCAVTVTNSGITVSPQNVSLFQGETETLTAEVLLTDGTTNSNVTWESENPEVVSVNGGVITAVAPGSTEITVTSIDDMALNATCAVTVHAPASVSLTRAEAFMLTGSGELRLGAKASYDSGSIISDEVDWSSADTGVVTVNAEGVVMPVGVGTTDVSAKVPNGSGFVTASCTIEVLGDADEIETVTENGVVLTLRNTDVNDIMHYSVKAENTAITAAVIPASINRVSVTEIEDEGFKDCNKLTSFTLGSNIVQIGSYAFYRTDVLVQNLTLNENTKMLKYAFARTQFRNVTISEGTTVVPLAAFQASGIRKVIFPHSLKEIKSYAFADCRWLTTADLTNTSLEMIGTEMVGTKLGNSFYECNALTSVGSLPNTLKEIGFATFLKCNNLVTISLGNDLRKIGGQAFFQCAKIPSLTIPSSVRIVGEGAFNAWGLDQTVNVAFASANEKPLGFHDNWLGDACRANVHYTA